MAISYSKGIREFEWPFEKAWKGLSNLYGTAQHHLDSFTGKKAINGHIRGYCFSNGLEKSFKLNYEIVLKNGVPTHLYDMRNERGDKLKNLLSLDNVLRGKLGMEELESGVIQNFQNRIVAEREALRNVKDQKFSSKEKEINVPLIPKNPENKKVIISNGPPEAEDGILEKNVESKQIVEIVGDQNLDTSAGNVELVKAEGDNSGEVVETQDEEHIVGESDDVIEENPEEENEHIFGESDDVEETPVEETIVEDPPTEEVVEDPPAEEEVVEDPPAEEEVVEEDIPEEEVVEDSPAEEEIVEDPPAEEEIVEDPPAEEEVVEESGEEVEDPVEEVVEEDTEDPVEDIEASDEIEEDPGVNEAGINEDGDLSVDPEITESEEDPESENDELSEFY